MNSNITDRGNSNNENANQGGCGNTRRGGNKNTPDDATFRRLITKKTVVRTVDAITIHPTVPREQRDMSTMQRALIKKEGLWVSAKKRRDGGIQGKKVRASYLNLKLLPAYFTSFSSLAVSPYTSISKKEQ